MINEYLQRIGVLPGEVSVDLGTLKMLQRRHLESVPFENLDIHWGRPIVLDIDRFYTKIVAEGRGGFCYELNGMFNELLQSLGFKTRLVSARVYDGIDFGPDFDHAAIIVTIGNDEFLADVGFGDFSTEPLSFVLDTPQADDAGTFIIKKTDDHFEVAKRDGDAWKSEYLFNNIARDLSEFTAMCDHQQFSAGSHFVKGKVCSLLTPTGRKTLTDRKFIVTDNGDRRETDVGSDAEFYQILSREFHITRPAPRG